jgi:hypothetical protein
MSIKDFFKRKPVFEAEDPNRGIVSFSDTQITIQNTAFSREKEVIEVDKIEYIYLETCHYSTSGLMIFQHRQFYIPVEYVNTEKLCLFLANRFQFDIQVIYSHIKDRVDAVYKLYRTEYTSNFEILKTTFKDYMLGFEILAPTPVWYPWTITKRDLLVSPYIICEDGYVEVTYPVRIGGIVVNKLGAYIADSREEVAIASYHANCYATDGSDKSFYQIKEKITNDLSETIASSFHNDGNLHFYAEADSVALSLSYSNDDNEMRSIAYSFSSFSVNTFFEYPELVSDTIYETIGQVDSIFCFAFEVEMRSNYKVNSLIKQTPLFVLEATEMPAFIWKDLKNKLVGFGDRKYAQWFEIDSIDTLTLWNTLPAKGGGFSVLSIELVNGESYVLFEGPHDTMSTQKEELEEYLGVKVLFFEDYNC